MRGDEQATAARAQRGTGEPPRFILAIDMGTGAVKAALVSEDGRVRAGALRSIDTSHGPGGAAEQDPEQWWAAVCAAAKEAIAASGLDPAAVCAIKCVTQWAVTVAVDAHGDVLAPAISWMDTRGGPDVRRLVHAPLRIAGYGPLKLRRWIALTGGAPVLSGIDSLGHILYLKHQRPDIYAAADKLLEPMDYLNLRLCGRAAASMGTVYPYWLTDNRDPLAIDYHPKLMALAGIDSAKLPEILPVDARVGELSAAAAAQLGLIAGTPVLTGTPDGQVAGVGAGAIAPGKGYFYIGTSSWMSAHAPAKRTDLAHMVATMPSALPGRYVVVAEQGLAGRCLDILKDNILYPASAFPEGAPERAYELMGAEAQAVPPGSDGVIFTPWINGVLVPRQDAHTRSAFFNITARTTRGHLVRAVMEGIAHNMRWLRPHVERTAGTRFEQLNFIGGGALSELWCQIHADVLGCPIGQVANPRYANAVGAALAGFCALGRLEYAELEQRVSIAALYRPVAERVALHDSRHRQFIRFYQRNRRIYRALNGS